jgi:hypothetical protein
MATLQFTNPPSPTYKDPFYPLQQLIEPHPFGMDFYTICCCLSGVLYFVEIVEGKDRPQQMGPPEFEYEKG